MTRFTRRQFLKGATAAGAALALPTQRVLGANDDVRMGFIAVGRHGSNLMRHFGHRDGVRVVALADPDREHLGAAHEERPEADAYTDFRRILDRDDVDAVVIANCVHWNAVAACWAVEAGKDVYVEKPHAHNLWESQQLAGRAQHYGKLVQVGTQNRSNMLYAELKEFLDSGEIGAIQYARQVTYTRYNSRGPIGMRDEPMTPPEHVEYDLWLGPAQDEPIYRDRLQREWHYVWNTGGGDATNWGAHWIDDVYNIVLRDPGKLPKTCMSAGGRVLYNDAGETPNAYFAFYETDSVPVSTEIHHLPVEPGSEDMGEVRGAWSGYVIQCEGGYYSGGRNEGTVYDNGGNEIRTFRGTADHVSNFLDAVRAQDKSMLNAPIEVSHYPFGMCHMGNVSYRLGETFDADHVREVASKHAFWEEVLQDFYDRLEAHGVDVENDPGLRSGPVIEMDPETETLTGPTATPEAEALLGREYREPYALKPLT